MDCIVNTAAMSWTRLSDFHSLTNISQDEIGLLKFRGTPLNWWLLPLIYQVMTNLDSILKSRDITLPTKVCLVKAMFFPVVTWMWKVDYEESWVLKNWCFWTVVLEKTLASPLNCKEIQSVHPKGDQSWVFIGRTDAKAETPILWPPDVKSWLIGKESDAGRNWGQEEKGTTEDEIAGWHHWLDGHESEWAPGVGDGQGGLACCSPWGDKELDTTERLNWTDWNEEKEEWLFHAESPGLKEGHWLTNRVERRNGNEVGEIDGR